MSIFVSQDARDYIRRLVLEADKRAGVDQSKGCETARVLDASMELENLAKMRAGHDGHTFVSPDDIKAMAVYVIARRHVGSLPYDILAEVPILVAKNLFVGA